MRELRDELRLGSAAVPVAGVLVDLRTLVDDLEPDQVPGRHAVDLVRVLDRIERIAASAKAQAMRRVAETDLWRRSGARTPADWLARETGVKLGEAIALLRTAEVSAAQPDTAEAVRSGQVSTRQGHAVATATQADPDAGRQLLQDVKARNLTAKEAEDASARIVAAASTEGDAERAERHRRGRRLWTGTTPDGMGWGRWLAPLTEHARLMSAVGEGQQDAFRSARAEGRHEPTAAYALDGLLALADRAPSEPTPAERGAATTGSGAMGPTGCTCDATVQLADAGTDTGGTACTCADTAGTAGARGAPGAPGTPRTATGTRTRGPGRAGPWGGAKVIVRLDATAADRGHTLPGERCEIAGHGPIPVADAWRIIDGGALVAAVLADGDDVQRALHLGRHPTALQRTALEWTTAGTCAIDGCNGSARIEIDHVAPWAATRRTQLGQLAMVCGHHHDLKTHHGFSFGPPGPDGSRSLVPPPGAGSSSGPAPPLPGGDGGTALPMERADADPDLPRDDAGSPAAEAAPSLFDTG